jgi:hypothetical protein
MPDFQRVHGQAIIGYCEGDYRRMQNALRDRLIGYDAVRENWRDGNDRTGSDEKNAPADASQRRPNEDRPGTCPACRRNLWPLWTTPLETPRIRKQGMNLTLQVGNRIAGLAPEPCF